MPTLRLNRRSTIKPESAYLNRFQADVTSQFGEDGVIDRIFEIIGSENRWCVEFGAWDGKYLSNTWTLLNEKDWSGVLIEGDPLRAGSLAESHRGHPDRVFVKNFYVGWENANCLDSVLTTTPIPADFDLLSIDIDGNDWHVWRALSKYRPRVVVIEYNPTASNQMVFIQDADLNLHQGCSLRALVELASDKKYELVAVTRTNGVFVRSELFSHFEIADNSIDAMRDEELTTEIAHGYDGTIFAAGHMMLNWHGVVLSQEDFQVLPKALRRYPDPSQNELEQSYPALVESLKSETIELKREIEMLRSACSERLALIERLDAEVKGYQLARGRVEGPIQGKSGWDFLKKWRL